MNLSLEGKKALITGGTAGIGQAIAQALAQEGASVLITGRSDESVGNALDSLKAIGAACEGIVADAATAEGTESIFRQVPSTDILVNNLGVYESKSFFDLVDDDWRSTFDTNVLTGVRLSRQYLSSMLAAKHGRVIFVASEAAVMVPSDMIPYAASKAALLAVSRGLAELTRGTDVTVNTVIPGPTRSAGIEKFLQSQSSNPSATEAEAEGEFFRVRRPTSLLQRLIDAREVANLVCYFSSPLASATNGAALRVEGGLIPTIL